MPACCSTASCVRAVRSAFTCCSARRPSAAPSGLARSTIGQMAVRIALQTSEADSQLILGDNNSAARLLSRPGEAIYNDAGGLVEGNSPFQVAWLPDAKREIYLDRVQQARSKRGIEQPRAADRLRRQRRRPTSRKNAQLHRLLDAPTWPAAAAGAVRPGSAIRSRSRIRRAIAFRRQSGANVLIVGQQDEAAMALMASAIDLASPPSSRRARRSSTCSTARPPIRRWPAFSNSVKAALPHEVKLVEYRAVAEAIDELAKELQTPPGRRATEPAVDLTSSSTACSAIACCARPEDELQLLAAATSRKEAARRTSSSPTCCAKARRWAFTSSPGPTRRRRIDRTLDRGVDARVRQPHPVPDERQRFQQPDRLPRRPTSSGSTAPWPTAKSRA